MLTKDIVYYCSCFKKLRRDRKNGGAPHKPILLISFVAILPDSKLSTYCHIH